MLFTKLNLNYFGRFHNKELELKPGINVIYGENEGGKSTIHTFIKGMLFGIERLRGRGAATKEDQYSRYLPWDYSGAFAGSMDIQIGDKEYRLQRSFHANDKNFTITNLSTGREVVLKEGLINEIIPGLTEAMFKNTVSIEQLKASTDVELALQVRNYIANLSIAKSNEVDVPKAISMLNVQRKQLETAISPTALKSLQVEIEEGLAKEERMDQLTEQLLELRNEEKRIELLMQQEQNRIDATMSWNMEQLPAILEKYRSYQELIRQEKHLEEGVNTLREKISSQEKVIEEKDILLEDITRVQKLQKQSVQVDSEEMELIKEKNRLIQEGKTKQLMVLLSPILLALILAAVTRMDILALIFAGIVLIVGIMCYITLGRKHINYQNNLAHTLQVLVENKKLIREEIDKTLHTYGVTFPEELIKKQQDAMRIAFTLENMKEQCKDLDRRRNELEDSRDSLYDIIMKYMCYFIQEEELTPDAIQRLQDMIQKRKQETVDKLQEYKRRLDNCRLSIERLTWEITSLEENEVHLLEDKERYKELEQKQKENRAELEAVKLALQAIQELAVDIHDTFGQELNRAVSEVISEVTGKKYTDIKVDEKLEIKVGWNQDYIQLDRLSAGTIDQVYFALRLAVAQLLLPNEELPVILDDTFVLYDDKRVKAAINKLAQRQQVIIFSCHNREEEILREMELPFHYLNLSYC